MTSWWLGKTIGKEGGGKEIFPLDEYLVSMPPLHVGTAYLMHPNRLLTDLPCACDAEAGSAPIENRDSFYNFSLSAATANLGSTRSLCVNDALPWVLSICFSALSAHSCVNVQFAILHSAVILSIMSKTY